MAIPNKKLMELDAQEQALYKALRNWYVTPGIQGEIRNKENVAIQDVLQILERRSASRKAIHADSAS